MCVCGIQFPSHLNKFKSDQQSLSDTAVFIHYTVAIFQHQILSSSHITLSLCFLVSWLLVLDMWNSFFGRLFFWKYVLKYLQSTPPFINSLLMATEFCHLLKVIWNCKNKTRKKSKHVYYYWNKLRRHFIPVVGKLPIQFQISGLFLNRYPLLTD